MKYFKHSQRGFTLIETLVAIFILALTIGALLTLTAGGFFSIRYAKNDIVASNLLQESLEYIRNTRDSASQRNMTDPSYNWDEWMLQYRNADCDTGRCSVNPYAVNDEDRVVACAIDQGPDGRKLPCERLVYYSDIGLYGYESAPPVIESNVAPIPTTFSRYVQFKEVPMSDGAPHIIVTATIYWSNGMHQKHLTQSIILTPWNLQQ